MLTSFLPDNLSKVVLTHPSVGRSPTGAPRIHIELPPSSVGRFVGYDPRVLTLPKPRTGKRKKDIIPHNVSAAIVSLQNRVQRSIDSKRVESMVEYLRAAVQDGQFADWGP